MCDDLKDSTMYCVFWHVCLMTHLEKNLQGNVMVNSLQISLVIESNFKEGNWNSLGFSVYFLCNSFVVFWWWTKVLKLLFLNIYYFFNLGFLSSQQWPCSCVGHEFIVHCFSLHASHLGKIYTWITDDHKCNLPFKFQLDVIRS